MILTWDEPKRLANIDKHGLDFAELTEAFFLNAFVIAAREPRFKAIGRMGDDTGLVVVFAPLGTQALSIVSMRRASKHERALIDARQDSNT